MAEIEKYAKDSRIATRKRRWPRFFLIFGLVLLFVVLLYRLLIYASYLEVGEARFSDKGGSSTIHVKTDAVFVSSLVHNGEWFTVTQSGKNIIVDVKENNGARDRQISFTVKTGVIDFLCKNRKEVTITQAGKGATYINASSNTVELKVKDKNDKFTCLVSIDTDGDHWEIVSCPDWVLGKTDGNRLELAAKSDATQDREGVVLLRSYNEYTNIRVMQKMKPVTLPKFNTKSVKVEPIVNPAPIVKSKPVIVEPKPEPLPAYNVQCHSVLDASSFSRIMVVDKEVDGETAFALLKKYKQEGWRPLIRSELLFVLENHRDMLPRCEHGYWIQYNNTEDLQSLSYGYEGNVDPTPNENRIAFVK